MAMGDSSLRMHNIGANREKIWEEQEKIGVRRRETNVCEKDDECFCYYFGWGRKDKNVVVVVSNSRAHSKTFKIGQLWLK